MSQPWS